MQGCFVSQNMPDVTRLKQTYHHKPENRKDQRRDRNTLSGGGIHYGIVNLKAEFVNSELVLLRHRMACVISRDESGIALPQRFPVDSATAGHQRVSQLNRRQTHIVSRV